jgi:hypothetical protein
MSMKKKNKKKHLKVPKKKERLKQAQSWLNDYKGEKEATRNEEFYHEFQDDTFYYIAGYTSGGAPYGVTWEEMELEDKSKK